MSTPSSQPARPPLFKLKLKQKQISRHFIRFCLQDIVQTLFNLKSLSFTQCTQNFYSVEFNLQKLEDIVERIKSEYESEELQEEELVDEKRQVANGCMQQNKRLFGTPHVVFVTIQEMLEGQTKMVQLISGGECSLLLNVKQSLLNEKDQDALLRDLLPNFAAFGGKLLQNAKLKQVSSAGD